MEHFFQICNDVFITIRPFLEVAILWVMIYFCLFFLRGTRGANILAGIIIILIVLQIIVDVLNFEVIRLLLEKLWSIIAFVIVVIFHPELRSAFAQLGSATPFTSGKLRKQEALSEVVQAITSMARQKVGALIVFERQISMRTIVNSAIRVESRISRQLLESIFYPNSPLHDGAVIIKDETVIAAHAILPLSQDESLVKTLGTRHRAAIGITEESDAVVVVVSEETGIISIACKGRMRRQIKPDKLQRFLEGLLLTGEKENSLQAILSSLGDSDPLSETFKGIEQ